MDDCNEAQRTVWCGNLSDKVSEEILYELFLQAGPLERVCIPKDKDGKQNNYGFITFKHLVSVQYAIELLNGTSLYDKRINIKPRMCNIQRQNSHQRDSSPISVQQIIPQNNMLNAIQNLNVLMQMGDQLLINNKVRSGNYDNNYNHSLRSAPYPRWEHSNYRDDRCADNRSSYRRNNHNNHRNSDRHNPNNHTSYRGSRRYDR